MTLLDYVRQAIEPTVHGVEAFAVWVTGLFMDQPWIPAVLVIVALAGWFWHWLISHDDRPGEHRRRR